MLVLLVLVPPMPNLITSVPGGLQRSRQGALKSEGLNNIDLVLYGCGLFGWVKFLLEMVTGYSRLVIHRGLSGVVSGPPTEQPTPPQSALP